MITNRRDAHVPLHDPRCGLADGGRCAGDSKVVSDKWRRAVSFPLPMDNPMRTNLYALLSALGMCWHCPPLKADWGFPSDLGRVRYESVVTSRMLDAAPTWKPENANPPVAARAAIRAADDMIRNAIAVDSELRLVLKEVSLTHLEDDKWVWIVHYEGRTTNGGGSTGIQPFVELVVLMDGKAIKPKQVD